MAQLIHLFLYHCTHLLEHCIANQPLVGLTLDLLAAYASRTVMGMSLSSTSSQPEFLIRTHFSAGCFLIQLGTEAQQDPLFQDYCKASISV